MPQLVRLVSSDDEDARPHGSRQCNFAVEWSNGARSLPTGHGATRADRALRGLADQCIELADERASRKEVTL